MTTEPVELREIPGPTALGGGWRRSLELLYLMASMAFKQTYFGTALGVVWSVGRPLMLFGVLLAVFTLAFHVGAGIPHYPVLLLLNIVLFGFFQEGTMTALPSMVTNVAVIRKTQFPRLVVPVASVLTALFNLGLNLIVAFIFILSFGVAPRWTWLLLFVVLAMLLVLTIAVAMILSSLYPRFRDLGIVWTVCATALFYGTPVLYTLDKFHSSLAREIISMNPLTPILELARQWIIDGHAHGPAYYAGGYAKLLIPVAIYAGICVLAVVVFRREAPRIAEAL
jgi:ABC-2 type transport system permease protein